MKATRVKQKIQNVRHGRLGRSRRGEVSLVAHPQTTFYHNISQGRTRALPVERGQFSAGDRGSRAIS